MNSGQARDTPSPPPRTPPRGGNLTPGPFPEKEGGKTGSGKQGAGLPSEPRALASGSRREERAGQIRIISAMKATRNEQRRYFEEIANRLGAPPDNAG